MKTEEERAAEEAANYKATLSELSSTSKIEINALTMLAEDNKEFAVHIAACIEDQLKSVPKNRKLPILYLIDSICKNYPKSVYVQLFTQNIVSNFCNVFEVSDEKVRKSLHKLRMTWDTTKIFPQKKLNAIDERVHGMDPNWPVLHKIPTVTRTQPPPQTMQQQPQQQQSHSQPVTNNSSQLAGPGLEGNKRNNQGRNNTKRKRVKLGQNRNHPQTIEAPVLHVLPPPQTFIDPNIIQAPQIHPIPYLDPSITIAGNEHLQPVPAANYTLDPNLIIAPSNEPQLTNQQLFCTPQQSQNQILPNIQEPQPAHLSVLESLYGGQQCSNCSLRFDDNKIKENAYKIHLDWHFRQNKKGDNMYARRKWYYPLDLWVQFREISDELQEDNNNDNDVTCPLVSDPDEVPTAPASIEDENNICSVCHETFEKFWAEEEEEWRLKNAKLYEDERVYHPLCLQDMLQVN